MERIGVVGAGAMGAGIAQVAAQAGLQVLLYDIGPGPLENGLRRIRTGLDRMVERGKLGATDRDAMVNRIATTSSLADFGEVRFVIEAVPEILDLKRQIFAELDRVCPAGAILATNTSSLSVTEVGAATGRPASVVGMHFFNPVPAMKLVEVVRGARTGPQAVERTTELARLLGKTPVQAKDTPGFIVNRIARPFPGEALRLLGENVATVQQIDRIARLAGGFRMGPFELMDLVGMDVNFAVNRSVFEQYFYDPRFRPHPLQAQMVKANLLGRKTGEGWYQYRDGELVDGPEGARFYGQPGPLLSGPVYVEGDNAMAELVRQAGYEVTSDSEEAAIVVCRTSLRLDDVSKSALVLVETSSCTATSHAADLPSPGRVVGYGGIPSVAERHLVEVAPGLRTSPEALEQACAFFHSLGRDTEVVQDSFGVVAPRLIACLVNEAAYALMEGIATAADIDTAMKLGVNYPLGPLEWADRIGLHPVLEILHYLHEHTGDDRYRPCPLLRKLVQARLPFHSKSH